MSTESARIVANLKGVLKAHGVTYKELARRVGLSEASVKRIFSSASLSVRRLEQMCDAVGTSVAAVAGMDHVAPVGHSGMLTLEQEKALATEPRLFACFHLVANGRSSREIGTELRAPASTVQRWLAGLRALGLVSRQTGARERPRATVAVRWRPDGPVQRMYEVQVRKEFLQSVFAANLEAFHFRSAELSSASCRVLLRKLDRLAAEFRDLAELDRHLPSVQKRNVGCLLAMRPWVLSLFAAARQ